LAAKETPEEVYVFAVRPGIPFQKTEKTPPGVDAWSEMPVLPRDVRGQ